VTKNWLSALARLFSKNNQPQFPPRLFAAYAHLCSYESKNGVASRREGTIVVSDFKDAIREERKKGRESYTCYLKNVRLPSDFRR